jgi:hypothetical protein
MLLNMAQTWEDLAANVIKRHAQQQRMKDIAAGPGGDDRAASRSIPVDGLNASNDE